MQPDPQAVPYWGLYQSDGQNKYVCLTISYGWSFMAQPYYVYNKRQYLYKVFV